MSFCNADLVKSRTLELGIVAIEPIAETAVMLAANLRRAGCAVHRLNWPPSSSRSCESSSVSERGSEPTSSGIQWSCTVVQCAVSDPSTVAASCKTHCTEATCNVAMRVWPRILGNATMHPLEKLQQKQSSHSPDLAERLFKDGYTEIVPVATLPDILANIPTFADPSHEIDLLKVDVEGSELRVLRGIDAGHWKRIRAVSLEVHNIGSRLQDVVSLLTAPLQVWDQSSGSSLNNGLSDVVRVSSATTGGSEALIGGGFSPACVVLHQPSLALSGSNNFHVFAWRDC